MQKLMLSMIMLLLLGFAACVEQSDEPTPDLTADPAEAAVEAPADPAAAQQSRLEPSSAPLQLETQDFSCRVVAWTCTSKAQCDAMCGGPGTGVCNFRTLCCACLI